MKYRNAIAVRIPKNVILRNVPLSPAKHSATPMQKMFGVRSCAFVSVFEEG